MLVEGEKEEDLMDSCRPINNWENAISSGEVLGKLFAKRSFSLQRKHKPLRIQSSLIPVLGVISLVLRVFAGTALE